MSEARAPSYSTGPSRRGCHRIEDWQRCRRFFAYRHLLRLRPLREREALAIGSLVHIGRLWLNLQRMGRPEARGVDPVEKMRGAPSRIAFAFEAARRLFDAMRDQEVSPHRVVAAEEEHEARIAGSLHTQRLDEEALFQSPSGAGPAFAVGDTKTTGGELRYVGDEWAGSLQMLSAEMFGRAIARRLGYPWRGVYVNAVSKRTFEFRRVWLHQPEHLFAEAQKQIVEANAEIDAVAKSERPPWRYTMNRTACHGRFGTCEYRALCDRGESALAEFVSVADEATRIEA